MPTLGQRPEWLAEAVASIEHQGERVRLVVVAPPESASIVRAQLPNCDVLDDSRSGIVPAIEAGWAFLDDCDLLGWLGDDDQLMPRSVQRAVERLLEHPGAAMVFGDYEYVNSAGQRLVTVRPGRLAPMWLRLGQNFIGQPGCLYLRDAIVRKGGLSPRLMLAFDVDLHLALAREGAVYCPFTLARVRTHPASLTVAERDVSMDELRAAVWGNSPRSRAVRMSKRFEPVWRLAGRFYYRFRRTY